MSDLDVAVRDNDTGLIIYRELSQWARSPSPGGPQNLLSYQTSALFAYVSFAFTGSRVAYYSDMAPDRGEYAVVLDGDGVHTGTAYSPTLLQSQELFSTIVSPGDHTSRVTNQVEGKVMGVRYFSYLPLDADSSFSRPAAPTPAPSDSRSRGTTPAPSTGGTQTSELPCQRPSTSALDPKGACADDRRPSKGHVPLIVGLLCGLLVGSLVAAVLVLRCRRQRQKRLVPLPPATEEEPQPPPYSREKPPTVISSHNPGKASRSVVSNNRNSNYTA